MTRNALNSGVCEFESPIADVSELIGEAFLVSPMKPKLSGRPKHRREPTQHEQSNCSEGRRSIRKPRPKVPPH